VVRPPRIFPQSYLPAVASCVEMVVKVIEESRVELVAQLLNRLRIIGALATAACVAGCARDWVRPGAESADLDREKFECQFEASKTIASRMEGATAEVKRAELETLCMQAKGWSRQ
jgi:hypothetical protein